MTDMSSSGHPFDAPIFITLTVRRRRVILIALLGGLVASAAVATVAPALGMAIAVLFGVSLGLDLVLLRRRQVVLAEQSMAAAFRARRPGRTDPLS
jgi:hypothetical protein